MQVAPKMKNQGRVGEAVPKGVPLAPRRKSRLPAAEVVQNRVPVVPKRKNQLPAPEAAPKSSAVRTTATGLRDVTGAAVLYPMVRANE